MRYLSICCIILLLGCEHRATLYNLETGEATPIKYRGVGHGTITAQFASGENLRGEFSTIAAGEASWGLIYASVYGTSGSAQGFSSRRSSIEHGTGIVTGDHGSIIQCEYVASEASRAGTGACQDNHGTKYKLMF